VTPERRTPAYLAGFVKAEWDGGAQRSAPEGPFRSTAHHGLRSWTVALADLAAHDAAAQSSKPLPDTVDAYGIVFDQWVKDYEFKTAILVVRRRQDRVR
jgi:hypothetical protein